MTFLTPLDSTEKQISRRAYNDMVSAAQSASNMLLVGADSTDIGNPVTSITPDPELGFWAWITDYCRDSGNNPIRDGAGYYLYQWQEWWRTNSGTTINWALKSPNYYESRHSYTTGPGVYYNPAKEIQNRSPQVGQIVWMFPGCLIYDSSGVPTHEMLFIQPIDCYAQAQSDWVMGTWRSGNAASPGTPDSVSVKLCFDYLAAPDNYNIRVFGPTQTAYFISRSTNMDPAVFGPYTNYAGTQAGDVIRMTFDFIQGCWVVTSAAYDDALNTVKFMNTDYTVLRKGWTICNGASPIDAKVTVPLPDTRGLFTRATDKPSSPLWTDKGTTTFDKYIGAADNTGNNGGAAAWGAGGRQGVSSSHKEWGDDPAGNAYVVQTLSDVESWSGPAPQDGSGQFDGAGNPINAVVCPPTWVLTQIIRYA